MTTRIDFTTPEFIHPGLSSDEQFFYDHAGWSYNPATEIPEEGRLRGAEQLRKAERHAKAEGWWVEWEVEEDPLDDDVDREEPYDQYVALLRDSEGEILGSLGSIDLGPGQCLGYDARPHAFDGTYPEPLRKVYDPYVRVVEAGLALDALD